MKKRLPVVFAVLLGMLLSLAGCSVPVKHQAPTNIKELYQASQAENLPIFLQEENQWVPYDVVTIDYNGNALLLRREVLPEPMAFNPDGNGYYAESPVDQFLNDSFLERFTPEMQAQILNTEIEICQKFPSTEQTETIQRKAFLLSGTEVQIDMSILVKEGKGLEFFKDHAHYGTQAGGQKSGWWLRSTYMMDRGLAWHIHADGTIGSYAVQQESGVRPALCVATSTPVVQQQFSEELQGYTLTQL